MSLFLSGIFGLTDTLKLRHVNRHSRHAHKLRQKVTQIQTQRYAHAILSSGVAVVAVFPSSIKFSEINGNEYRNIEEKENQIE